jgi:hypothetical protein
MRVTADVNGDIDDGLDNAKPDAVDVDTAPSAVVQPRPVPPAPAGGGGEGPPPGPPGAAADALAPELASFAVTNKRFVVGPRATPVSAGSRRTPTGTTFRFRLSEPATATLTIDRLLAGRKVGNKCKPPSRKLRKRRKCTRLVRAGTLTRRNLPAGANSVPFSGRIGKKKLAVGSYQTSIVATDTAGNKSRPRTLKFTIVRR